MTIPSSASPKPERFLLAVGASFSAPSDVAVDQAVRLALRIPGCELHLIRAVGASTVDERLEELAERLEQFAREIAAAVGGQLRHVAVHIRIGRPSRVILDVVRELDADLVVLGARRARLRRASTVTRRVMANARCPVFVATTMPAETRSTEPEIEPPCPDCVATRQRSRGERWWCARHAEHHLHGHAYRYHRELPLRMHDSATVPTGVDVPRFNGV